MRRKSFAIDELKVMHDITSYADNEINLKADIYIYG